MANFETLKTAIDANINTNGKQAITGSVVNNVMHQMVDATSEQLTELESAIERDERSIFGKVENLFSITTKGGFLGESGTMTSNSLYDSCLLKLENGQIYAVVNQLLKIASENYVRIFVEKDNVFTQELIANTKDKGGLVVYACPEDGRNYYIQVVYRLDEGGAYPFICKVKDHSILARIESLSKTEDEIKFIKQEKKRDNLSLFGGHDDLFTITKYGGYVNASGIMFDDYRYNSCFLSITNGKTYAVINQYFTKQTSGNSVRVFVQDGDAYKQVYWNIDGLVVYTCPNDGKNYFLQAIEDTTYQRPLPSIYEVNENSLLAEVLNIAERDERSIFGKVQNLFSITRFGGFLMEDGSVADSDMWANYDSCLLPLTNGKTYAVVNQLLKDIAENNVRVFVEKDNGALSQIHVSKDPKGGLEIFACPNDGKKYFLQVVYRKGFGSAYPFICEVKGNSLLDMVLNNNNNNNKSERKHIKILAIGNSYSRDGLSYLPFLLEDILDCDVTIGILYKGSCTLEQHNQLISNNGNYEAFDFYTTKNATWTTTPSQNIDYALSVAKWDFITLQQQSSNSRNYDTYQPYLNNVVNLLYSKLNHSVKFGWLLTPSYPDNYSGLNGDTSDSMFDKICVAAEKVLKETAIEFVIPMGTAKQNATKTSLNNLGDFGGMFYEGLHLQDGLPCLIEAYAAAISVMNMTGYGNKGIFGNGIRPTQEWLVSKNIPQQHGASVGVNDDNCRIAQLCAIVAVKNPYEITNVSELSII